MGMFQRTALCFSLDAPFQAVPRVSMGPTASSTVTVPVELPVTRPPAAATALWGCGVPAARKVLRPQPLCCASEPFGTAVPLSCLKPGCEEGMYGEGCQQRCDCVGNTSCDRITGRCLCPPGTTGPKCASGEDGQ